MEWKIGEIKQIKGEWYQCVRGQSEEKCTGCFFEASPICIDLNCLGNERKDHTKVIFKKLEKVGEPFYSGFYCSWLQKYKLYDNHAIGEYPKCHFGADYVLIELKQNKEDMEEKKIQISKRDFDYLGVVIRRDIVPLYTTHNELATDIMNLFTIVDDTKHSNSEKIENKLKLFDLEAAKQGKTVCTRDGRKARIICFDKQDERPIIALIQNNNREDVYYYHNNGVNLINNTLSDNDLMMLPEKKEGWAVIFKDDLLRNEQDAKDLAELSISEVIKIEKIEYME